MPDPVYPHVGETGVDTLHYRLALTWVPRTRLLRGTETVVLRATRAERRLRLDLAPSMRVSSLTVGGVRRRHQHVDDKLIVSGPWTAGQVATVVLHYAGVPRQLDGTGGGTEYDARGDLRTIDEPSGAFEWYAVNDQPSDKAFYDLTLRVPPPMVGVGGGRLVSESTTDRFVVTRWHLDQPAASYLVALSFARYTRTDGGSVGGVPLTYWTAAGQPALIERMRYAPTALRWVESRLGPFPFATLSFIVGPTVYTGVETQTAITLGTDPYTTSPAVLVHEIAHQWYGDEVTPRDWSDMWMNEGMAMYLQLTWQAEHDHRPVHDVLQGIVAKERQDRRLNGPPVDYNPRFFASLNVYYAPALMYDQIRRRIGDALFWRLVRAWPRVHRFGNADRAEYEAWWSRESGTDLSDLFTAWLTHRTSPAWS